MYCIWLPTCDVSCMLAMFFQCPHRSPASSLAGSLVRLLACMPICWWAKWLLGPLACLWVSSWMRAVATNFATFAFVRQFLHVITLHFAHICVLCI